ncbi:BrnA antitoxin family protein [bacterium]|nr:BrnA antitoxin family protein [bacterium]
MQKKKRASKTDWEKVDSISEREIKYSEIPELNKRFWKEAELVMPENKTKVTIRLDNDVINWFKSHGKGYQTKINTVLKSYIQAQS